MNNRIEIRCLDGTIISSTGTVLFSSKSTKKPSGPTSIPGYSAKDMFERHGQPLQRQETCKCSCNRFFPSGKEDWFWCANCGTSHHFDSQEHCERIFATLFSPYSEDQDMEFEVWSGECRAKQIIKRVADMKRDQGSYCYDFAYISPRHEWGVMGTSQYCRVCEMKR
jgi:hypothetical protein